MKYLNCVLLCISLLFNSHFAYAKMPTNKSNEFLARYFRNLAKIDLKTIFLNELKDKVTSQELERLKSSKFQVKSSYRDGKHYLTWKINKQVLIDFSLDISKKEFVNHMTKKTFPLSSQKEMVVIKKNLINNLKDLKIVTTNKINIYDLIFFGEAHAMAYALFFLITLIIDLFFIPIQHLFYWGGSFIQWIERHLDLSDNFCCTLSNRFLDDIKNGKLKTKACEKSAAKLTERLVNFSNGDITEISNNDEEKMMKKLIYKLKNDLDDLNPSSKSVFEGFLADHFYTDKLEDLMDTEQVVKSLHSMFKKCNEESFLVKTGEDWNFYSVFDAIGGSFKYKSSEMPTIEIENSRKCRNLYSDKEEEIQRGLIAMSRDFTCNEKLNSTFEEYRQSIIQIEEKSKSKSVNWSKRSIKEKTEDFINWTRVLSRPSSTEK